MNKKAIFLSLYLFLLAIGVYTQAYFILQDSRTIIMEQGKLGSRAAHLADVNEAQQRVQAYLDLAGRKAFRRALHVTLENGGLMRAPCGRYQGAPYWRGRNTEETLNACGPQPRSTLKAALRNGLAPYLEDYPQQPYPTSIPATYHFHLQDEKNLVLTATGLELVMIRAPIEDEVTTLSTYPRFTIRHKNLLREFDGLRIIAQDLLSACSGSVDPPSCVADYLATQARRAQQQGTTYTYPDYGSACASGETAPRARSLVFCKAVNGISLRFALHFPSAVPLVITQATFSSGGEPLAWTQPHQVLGSTGEVQVALHVTTPHPEETNIELCSTRCTTLYQGQALAGARATREHNTIYLTYRFTPTEQDYFIKARVAGEEAHTPTNTIILSQ